MPESRAGEITLDLVEAINGVVRKHQITHAEYRQAIDFLFEAVEAGETSLLFDAFLEADVVAANEARQQGTPSQVLGPFYISEPPWLENGQLATRDEEGERLTLSGRVVDTDGKALAGAVLDFWQADAQGRYSNFDEGPIDGNLRGRLRSDESGRYTLHTVRPAPYTIPHHGPTGRLLEAVGRHPWRPAHLHLIATHPGKRALTTQIYFEGDEYLDSDAVRAARSELALPTTSQNGGLAMTFDIELEDA